MSDLAPRDRELAARVRQTLEASIARPDPQLDAALAATRAQVRALPAPAGRSTGWLVAGGLALAASLAMVLVMPRLPGHAVPAPVVAEIPSEDPQFLEDMEMLSVLGEDNRES